MTCTIIVGILLSVKLGIVAVASDYIVITSTDVSIKRGQSFDAGARLALGAG